jgi:hypothetical protein
VMRERPPYLPEEGAWTTHYENMSATWIPTCLLIYTTAIWTHTTHTIAVLIHEISHALNVWCFNITSQPRGEEKKD